eukprot:5497466-Pyramimonas_sp.AAC.1
MRTEPLGPSVELPMGPRSAVMGGVDACGSRQWSLRWSPQWGHEACEGRACMGGVDACEPCQWSL